MRPVTRAAALVLLPLALAATSCGDVELPPEDAPPADTAPAAHVGRAERPSAVPVPAADTPARREARRALDDYARAWDGDDTDAMERLEADLAAQGAAAIDELIAWFAYEGEEDDARRELAERLLRRLGLEAVPALTGLVRTGTERGADRSIRLLHDLAGTWNGTDLARGVATAALDARDRYPESDIVDLDDVVAVLLDAGAAATSLADRVTAHLTGDPDEAASWLAELDDRPSAAADLLGPRVADLVALLRSEEDRLWSPARAILLDAMPPPAPAVDAILAMAAETGGEDRYVGLRIASAWASQDERCSALALAMLGGSDERARERVVQGWKDASWVSDDLLRAAIRACADANGDVSDAAEEVVSRHLDDRPGATALLESLLRNGGADEIAGACSALGTIDDEATTNALMPVLTGLLGSSQTSVRLAVLRALDDAPWSWEDEDFERVCAAAAPLLDDRDAEVRAYAAYFLSLGEEPPVDRIVAAARPLLDSPDATDNVRELAFRALRWADGDAAVPDAARMLASDDADVRYRARMALQSATPGLVVSDAALAGLVASLEDDPDEAVPVLLRVEGGLEPLGRWLDERFREGDRDDVRSALRWIVDAGEPGRAAEPWIRRLAARDGYAATAEFALALLDEDADRALARLSVTMPEVGADDASTVSLATSRLVDLGARGVELLMRWGQPAGSLWNEGAWVFEREPDAVRAGVAGLTTSRDRGDRRGAVAWARALPAAEAIDVLARLARDTDTEVGSDARDQLHEMAGEAPDVWPPLVRACLAALRADDAMEGFNALLLLQDAPPLEAAAITALRDVVASDTDAENRALAAALVLRHGGPDPDAVRAIVAAMRQPGDALDGAWQPALRALLSIGADAAPAAEAIPQAWRATGMEDETRNLLLELAGSIGPAAANCVPTLRSALLATDDTYEAQRVRQRLAAMKALGRIGAAAQPVLPDLERLAHDPALRTAATDAIRAIRSASR